MVVTAFWFLLRGWGFCHTGQKTKTPRNSRMEAVNRIAESYLNSLLKSGTSTLRARTKGASKKL